MGITGLIPFLEKASSKVHLKDLRGSTVAVDTYCWLHKGVFSCADKLCRGEDTDLYVRFCLKYVTMLLSYDIKPILVFDGRHLPAKALTEKRRREGRDQSRKRAAELLRLGRTDEARSHMRRCIDVTHEMALRLIKECRTRNVDCIVAPYEADAQMAFLNKLGIAQYIITEDSDLVLFGCKKIVFKLDLTGAGLLVDADKLHLAMGCCLEKYTFDKFRVMCILSGCDYLDSLPGIGLAKACKFILKTEEDNMNRALRKIPQYLNMRHIEVDDNYIEGFLKADATFKHMYVYNPLKRHMERLHCLSTWNTDERYCSNAGEILDDNMAFQLALGNVNPFSLKILDTWNPDNSLVFSNVKRAKHKSIWLSNFQSHNQPNKPISGDIRCALQFKKVTYSFLREEAEEQRPEEGDIVSLYNDVEPPKKRLCSATDNVTEPVQVTPTKKPYNPFPMVSPREKKPILDLLLKPSPKKVPPLNPFKRSIFSTTTEVRSRFFASNVSLADVPEPTDITTKIPTKTDDELIEEVTRIQVLSEKYQETAAALYDYNSPSPVKCCKIKASNVALADAPELSDNTTTMPTKIDDELIEEVTRIQVLSAKNAKSVAALYDFNSPSPLKCCKIKDDLQISHESKSEPSMEIPLSIDSGISSLRPTGSESSTQLSSDVKEKYEPLTNEVIELSDSEEKVKFKTLPKKTPVKKSRTVGLPKLTKLKSTSKLPVNQTRLSMFGFQKRPSLK